MSTRPNERVRQRRRIPAQERSRRRVERVLDAAAQVVVERGVDAVSMRSIAAASGVPAPSVYQYFADKDAILLALAARDMEEMDAQVLADLAEVTDLTLPLLVETTMRAFVTVYHRRPAFLAVWLRGRANAAIERAGREHNRHVAETLREVAEGSGLVSSDLPERAALLAVEIGDRVFQLAFEGSDTGDEQLIEEGITMITSYLARYAVEPGA